MVALTPIGLVISSVPLAMHFGMSAEDYINLAKYSGVEQWDIIAVIFAMLSGYLLFPLYLFCVKNSSKKLEKFASHFPTHG